MNCVFDLAICKLKYILIAKSTNADLRVETDHHDDGTQFDGTKEFGRAFALRLFGAIHLLMMMSLSQLIDPTI